MSSGTKFKESREAERKSQAGNRVAWNTLFMRSDTVAESVAAHYGISKSQLLSKDAADLPVRMALGEAHVIATTKKALGDAGECACQHHFKRHFQQKQTPSPLPGTCPFHSWP